MKYPTNSKIEFKTVPYYGDRRMIFYRIVPSELVWWKRLFFNKWVKLFRAFEIFGGTSDSYTLDIYLRDIRPLQTFGEVNNYLSTQIELSNKNSKREKLEFLEKVKRGEVWPD